MGHARLIVAASALAAVFVLVEVFSDRGAALLATLMR
jgi:hypothetical protein